MLQGHERGGLVTIRDGGAELGFEFSEDGGFAEEVEGAYIESPGDGEGSSEDEDFSFI